MQTIKQAIDHAVEVFRAGHREAIVIGLTAADWDRLCAEVMTAHNATHQDLNLTRDAYDDVPIRHLEAGQTSFVAHDTDSHAERRFPVAILEPV